MRKTSWERLAVVLGITLLAVAVAFMPACDTGESCDLDLETLNGNWHLIRTLERGGVSELNAAFTVSGDTLTIEPEWDDPEVFDLDCGGDQVTLSRSEKGDIKDRFPDSDCTLTMTQTIRVTVSSPDAFAGTHSFVLTLSGPDCAEIEAFLAGEPMEETAEVTGTRLEL